MVKVENTLPVEYKVVPPTLVFVLLVIEIIEAVASISTLGLTGERVMLTLPPEILAPKVPSPTDPTLSELLISPYSSKWTLVPSCTILSSTILKLLLVSFSCTLTLDDL